MTPVGVPTIKATGKWASTRNDGYAEAKEAGPKPESAKESTRSQTVM